MPPRKAMKNAELREDSIHRLSQAAFQLIVMKGYHATTLQEIAEAAGMTKGAIFFYFNGKERLLLHLLDVAEQHIVDSLAAHLASINGTAFDKIIAYFHFGSWHGIKRPFELLCLIQISIEFRHRPDAIGKRIVAIYDRIYHMLEGIIEVGRLRGEIPKDLPSREVVSTVVATHDGMMLEYHRREIDGEKLVRVVRTTFLHGLALQPRKKPARRAR